MLLLNLKKLGHIRNPAVENFMFKILSMIFWLVAWWQAVNVYLSAKCGDRYEQK